ncbi:MAG: tRNA pseudouridine(38-40) synthase TruA [Planctomycetia bacterium]|nr:tRNA pseudouridine(38-40) synthase TruA [Planctomycetia bacterium]
MERNIRLTLAYNGAKFHGWQQHEGVRTVQGELASAVARISGGVPFEILGSSRTDAGVHALGQVASLRVACRIPTEAFPRALNAWLPDDVVVRSAEEMAPDFHPIRDTERKRYRYLLHDGSAPELFASGFVWRVARLSSGRLDAEKMNEAAQFLQGTHDFAALENVGSPRTHSIRTIFDVSVSRGVDSREEIFPILGSRGDFVSIEVEADGFLYNMVRNIAGTLMEVGRGRRPSEWVGEVLSSKDRALAGPTAPAQGLFLLWIRFRPPDFGSSSVERVPSGDFTH